MKNKICCSVFCIIFLSLALLSTEAYAAGSGMRKRRRTKLFVFGDSYADTGNSPRPGSKSWRPPYGITFPGNPSGRFSDGRVLTDYFASFLGVRSPMPYERKNLERKSVENGINFAYGGTGVFRTMVDLPNMTTQIDFLQQLIHDKNLYTWQNLSYSSVALLSLGGNDYSAYLAKNGTLVGLPIFIRSVVNQLILNVNRIHSLGIKKIAVTGMPPVGCLPKNTASNAYQTCVELGNNISVSHNLLLNQNLLRLSYNVTYLNLDAAFTSALKLNQNPPQGKSRNDVLKPCCVGPNGEDCGSTGENKYVVCEDPKNSFFWDSVHPSNQGWAAVHNVLLPSLKVLLP